MNVIKIKKIAKIISIIVLIPFITILLALVYWEWNYYDEMNNIKKELNSIPNVSVIDIWAGNEDITLEEVTARIRIQGKGELVLYGLSNDVYNYPTTILISEIGGFSFRTIDKNSYGHNINIGEQGGLKTLFSFKLNTPKDVISHYDEILKIVKNWSVVPKLNHIHYEKNKEFFIAVLPQKVHNGDDFIQQDYHDNFNKYFSDFSTSNYEQWSKFINKLPWENNNSK
jgi:hypothetical protein